MATDVMGVSGRAMIQRLIEGEMNPHQLADLAQKQLRGKIPELEKALEGKLRKELAQQEEVIAELEMKIEEQTRPYIAGLYPLSKIQERDFGTG